MQELVRCEINEGEDVALRLLWLCTRCRGSLGKQVGDGDTHRFHDRIERAACETGEQDLSFVAQTDTETGFPIAVCRTACHPSMQRFSHPFEMSQDCLYRGIRE